MKIPHEVQDLINRLKQGEKPLPEEMLPLLTFISQHPNPKAIEVVQDRLAVARTLIEDTCPYVLPALSRCLLYWCRPDEVLTCQTSYDGIIALNPMWFLLLEPHEVAANLLHEVTHLLLKHAYRYPGGKPQKWNVAADLEVNCRLPWTSWSLLYPEQFGLQRGQIAEQYFCQLKEEPGNHGHGDGDCGSCIDRSPRAWEGKARAETSQGRENINEEELEHIRDEVAYRAEQWRKERGFGDGLSEMLLGNIKLSRQVPWEKVLRASIRRSVYQAPGCGTTSYRRLGRRTWAQEGKVISPVWISQLPDVLAVIDTSGSMHEEVKVALGEILSVTRSFHVPLRVVQGDMCITEVKDIQSVKDLRQFRVKGLGGTSMAQVIDEYRRKYRKHQPSVFVLITDGYTDWPEVKPWPSTRCVLVITPEGQARQYPRWFDLKVKMTNVKKRH